MHGFRDAEPGEGVLLLQPFPWIVAGTVNHHGTFKSYLEVLRTCAPSRVSQVILGL